MLFLSSTNRLLAHQKGMVESHITVNPTSITWLFTLPIEQLETLFTSQEKATKTSAYFSDSKIKLLIPYIKILNNEIECQLLNIRTGTLTKISSEQILMTWSCTDDLGSLTLKDLTSTIKSKKLFSGRYNNFVRFSIAGHHKDFVFTADHISETIPIDSLLEVWNKNLTDIATKNIKVGDQPFFSKQSLHFIPIGIEHILLGWDHIAFLIALLLLISNVRQLLVLITCFTVAHSIALAMSVFNIVNISATVIEPLIALSIIVVALENFWLLNQSNAEKLTVWQKFLKNRWIIILLFGFIHGFGFSFLLKELGHKDDLLPSLLFFNIGVEIGQLIIVAPIFLLLTWLSNNVKWVNHLKLIASLLTALSGLYWLVLRII